MFTLYPAIDLLNGHCVRLFQGDYAQSTIYADSPVEVARAFAKQGAKWLHVVDLDGAKAGKPENREIIFEMAAETGINIEVGGGVRSMATIDDYLAHGIKRVILGSSAIADPDFTRAALKKYPEAVAIGLDVKNGKVAVEGWLAVSAIEPAELAQELIKAGASHFIYTDISKDGAMEGTNLDEAVRLARAIGQPVVISGGVSSLNELRRIVEHADSAVSGAIIGKALYTGAIDLSEAEEMVTSYAR